MKLTIKYAVPGALIEDTIELPNDVGEVVVALSESERNELHLFNVPDQGK
jgi:hypothetical protein